jgi:hypothetical protein
VIVRVYVDDSSDQKQEVAISAGAFLGKFGDWCQLKNRWARRLKQEGLAYFRATEYYSLRGEFERFRDRGNYPKPRGSEAAKQLRDDLEQIIRQSKIVGVALVIPLELYWKIKHSCPAANQIFTDDPFEMAIQSLMDQCVKDSIEKMDSTPLSFFCDDGPNAKRVLATYKAYKALNPNADSIVQSLEHRDDKKFPQLQVADLMAHLGRETYMTKQEPNGICDSIEWVKVWDEEYMLELLEHEKKRRNL